MRSLYYPLLDLLNFFLYPLASLHFHVHHVMTEEWGMRSTGTLNVYILGPKVKIFTVMGS